MSHRTLVLLPVLEGVLSLSLFAQSRPVITPVPEPPRNAGVYHAATGTWSHGGTNEALGPKVLYNNNDAFSGFYGAMGVPADLVWTDEGRIPGTSGHPNATSDLYVVDRFDFAYCSSVPGGPQQGSIRFYECYASCTDPLALPVLREIPFQLPGGAGGATACWIVTFDLAGSGLVFHLAGDCEGTFDGTSATDSFGWTLTLEDDGANGFNGPFLCGDPPAFPYGDGTYYQNPGSPGTGLDTRDQFWMNDASGAYANGCYWFSGAPFTSFYLEMRGDTLETVGTRYCPANPNSVGAAATLFAIGSASASAGDLTLEADPVPDQMGVFLHGPDRQQLPFGNGYLCVQAAIVRGKPVQASDHTLSYTFDNSDAAHSLLGFVGTTRYFQGWFRDPAAGGAAFNTSGAVAISILP